jgi:hypothetical protein
MSGQTYSYAVSVNDIPAAGKRFHIEANEDERRSLAEALGILEIAKLTADIEVRVLHGRTLSVKGEIAAAVVQTDVVTLEPIPQIVAEEIDVTLVPAEGPAPVGRPNEASAGTADLEAPDVYRHGRIDLGAIAREYLAMGLNPYPRGEGAEFPGHVEDSPAAEDSPFAKLAALKREKDA